jgi:hypothetical protein
MSSKLEFCKTDNMSLAPCETPLIDLTETLPGVIMAMDEGKVTFNGKVVKSLSQLNKLYIEYRNDIRME